MDKLKLLLWPLAALYAGVTSLRNTAYNKGWFASRKFELPVIAVGNLTVGGTGKTPHVEYLLRLLRNYKVATLSRGYKRATKGFILADGNATATTIGDEPYQYHQDFPDVQVAVCEKRVEGVEKLLQQDIAPEVIVLDDAMQHRAIQPSLNLLLTDYTRLFYKDHVLPAGLLRETKTGAGRADAILVTKCPATLHPAEIQHITSCISKYSQPGVHVFFTGFRYGQFRPIGNTQTINQHVLLLTGIANAAPLVQYLKEHQFRIVHHTAFPDHHAYTPADLKQLQQVLAMQPAGTIILTTRKDAVKLLDGELKKLTEKLPVFYIPIEVHFLNDAAGFDKLVLEHVQRFREV